MNPIATKTEHPDSLSVAFFIEAPEVLALGEQMEALNEQAYMNGYNWAAFLHAYLTTKHPHLLAGMITDPEAGMYVALYPKAESAKADVLVALIRENIAAPEDWLRFLEAEGDEIEWD